MTEYLLGSCNSSDKSAIYCWNYTTGNVEHIYRSTYTSLRNSLCVLSNDYVLTAEEDKPLLHLWPLNSQESKVRLILPGKPQAVCVDSSSTYLLVGIDVCVYIWMINSGELLNKLEKNYKPVSCVKVSNTTEHIIVAGIDGMLTTYNFNDLISRSIVGQCEPLYTKNDHSDAITDISIGNFGVKSRIVSVSVDRTCRVYSLHSGDPLKVIIFGYGLYSVMLDVACWNVYVGGQYGTVSLVELENDCLMQDVKEGVPCFQGHRGKITCIDINIGHNVLATASDDCLIIIWDLKTRKQLRTIKQELPPTCLRFLSAHIDSKPFKPQIVLKPLKKSIVLNVENIESSIMHTKDIEFEDSVKPKVTNDTSTNDGDVENLKIVNQQLYNSLIALIRKNYDNEAQ